MELILSTPTFTLWRGDLLANTRLVFAGADWALGTLQVKPLAIAIRFACAAREG